MAGQKNLRNSGLDEYSPVARMTPLLAVALTYLPVSALRAYTVLTRSPSFSSFSAKWPKRASISPVPTTMSQLASKMNFWSG